MSFVFFDSKSRLLRIEPFPATEVSKESRAGNKGLTNMHPYIAMLLEEVLNGCGVAHVEAFWNEMLHHCEFAI